MGGLAVFLLIGLYIFITYKAVKYAKPASRKMAVLVVMILIPTSDAVIGRLYLKHLCAVEGGLKVYKVAHNVEGFMEQFGTDYWVRNGGYSFTENFPRNSKVIRYSNLNGQIFREDNVTPKSLYRVSSKYIGDTKNIFHRNQFLIDTSQGEILATDTQVAFNGGWVERFLAQFSDAGGGTVAWCTNTELDPVIRHRRIVSSTLKHSGE